MPLFAQERHRLEDVRWLKENAELLRLLVATGQRPGAEAVMAAYSGFLPSLSDRLQFFPQYYRFFLSIALDLEALGAEGIAAAELVDWAMTRHLPAAELSDLQRAEAELLATRAGVAHGLDAGLTERLLAFGARSETFALPNRKAGYELTHIAFYLSDYGRHPFEGAGRLAESLHNVGLIAHLDGNTDLLAEICLALRHCGLQPPADWDQAVAQGLDGFELGLVRAGRGDDYHAWLMAAWSMESAGRPVLAQSLPAGPFQFLPPEGASTLLEVSAALLDLGAGRSGDWAGMRRRLAPRLSGSALAHIDGLAASTPQFERFFAGFARVPRQGAGW